MSRDGLIRRSPHASDRRQEHVHLTQRARSLVPNLAAIADEVNGQALHGMSRSEARTFMQMLHSVIENLNADEASHQARIRNDAQDTPPVSRTPGARGAGAAGAETNIRP